MICRVKMRACRQGVAGICVGPVGGPLVEQGGDPALKKLRVSEVSEGDQ